VHRFIGSASWSCVRWHLAHEEFVGVVVDEDIVVGKARQLFFADETIKFLILVLLSRLKTRASANQVLRL
jgi:hypothetical protein